jgi:hypothetical protein
MWRRRTSTKALAACVLVRIAVPATGRTLAASLWRVAVATSKSLATIVRDKLDGGALPLDEPEALSRYGKWATLHGVRAAHPHRSSGVRATVRRLPRRPPPSCRLPRFVASGAAPPRLSSARLSRRRPRTPSAAPATSKPVIQADERAMALGGDFLQMEIQIGRADRPGWRSPPLILTCE